MIECLIFEHFKIKIDFEFQTSNFKLPCVSIVILHYHLRLYSLKGFQNYRNDYQNPRSSNHQTSNSGH